MLRELKVEGLSKNLAGKNIDQGHTSLCVEAGWYAESTEGILNTWVPRCTLTKILQSCQNAQTW